MEQKQMKLKDIMPIYFYNKGGVELINFPIIALKSNKFTQEIFIDVLFQTEKRAKKFRKSFIYSIFDGIESEYLSIFYHNRNDCFMLYINNTLIKHEFKSLREAKKAKIKVHEFFVFCKSEMSKKCLKNV